MLEQHRPYSPRYKSCLRRESPKPPTKYEESSLSICFWENEFGILEPVRAIATIGNETVVEFIYVRHIEDISRVRNTHIFEWSMYYSHSLEVIEERISITTEPKTKKM